MTWSLGTGELANRIARAFGVKGRIPADLDSSVVGVALLSADANGPPFRTDGRFCFNGNLMTGGIGVPAIGVRNESNSDQVIDYFSMRVPTAQQVTLVMQESFFAGAISTDSFRTFEGLAAQTVAGIIGEQVPLTLTRYDGVGGGENLAFYFLAANVTLTVDLQVVLPPGYELIARATTATSDFHLSVRARFFRRGPPRAV